ncbi:MAG: hypothetical protein KGH49_04370, partial [Candidatus Micrarchaeota archaeon]|nr:hypothetical protein [Candidatus Micrarchaeota archaeon]
MGDYDKISLMLFAVLSVVGIVLAALLIAFFGPLMGIIWLAIFVACYFKLTESRTVFTYLFILSAPSSINGLVAILIPT